jgi:hypothetical protein
MKKLIVIFFILFVSSAGYSQEKNMHILQAVAFGVWKLHLKK